MARRKEAEGQRVLPGVWKLKKDTYVVRAQPLDLDTGRRRNLRRLITGVTLREAIEERDRLGETTAPPAAARPIDQPTTPSATTTGSTDQTTLGSFARSWLERKIARGDLAPATQQRYAQALDHLSPRLKATCVAEISPEMVEAWQLAARKRYAASTINSWLRVLRVVLNDARRPFGLVSNAAEEATFLREPINLDDPNALESEQLIKLLRALDAVDPSVRQRRGCKP